MALAQRAGLGDLAAEHVRIGRACGVNAHLKVACLAAPAIVGTRLRGGSAASSRGAASFATASVTSGSFSANAAWLTCAAIAHNLLRAAGSLASLAYAKARGATLRRDLINLAARIARHGRSQITVHLPAGWHRETG